MVGIAVNAEIRKMIVLGIFVALLQLLPTSTFPLNTAQTESFNTSHKPSASLKRSSIRSSLEHSSTTWSPYHIDFSRSESDENGDQKSVDFNKLMHLLPKNLIKGLKKATISVGADPKSLAIILSAKEPDIEDENDIIHHSKSHTKDVIEDYDVPQSESVNDEIVFVNDDKSNPKSEIIEKESNEGHLSSINNDYKAFLNRDGNENESKNENISFQQHTEDKFNNPETEHNNFVHENNKHTNTDINDKQNHRGKLGGSSDSPSMRPLSDESNIKVIDRLHPSKDVVDKNYDNFENNAILNEPHILSITQIPVEVYDTEELDNNFNKQGSVGKINVKAHDINNTDEPPYLVGDDKAENSKTTHQSSKLRPTSDEYVRDEEKNLILKVGDKYQTEDNLNINDLHDMNNSSGSRTIKISESDGNVLSEPHDKMKDNQSSSVNLHSHNLSDLKSPIVNEDNGNVKHSEIPDKIVENKSTLRDSDITHNRDDLLRSWIYINNNDSSPGDPNILSNGNNVSGKLFSNDDNNSNEGYIINSNINNIPSGKRTLNENNISRKLIPISAHGLHNIIKNDNNDTRHLLNLSDSNTSGEKNNNNYWSNKKDVNPAEVSDSDAKNDNSPFNGLFKNLASNQLDVEQPNWLKSLLSKPKIFSHENSHKDHSTQDSIGSNEQLNKDHSTQDTQEQQNAIGRNEQSLYNHAIQDAIESHNQNHKDSSIQDANGSHEQRHKNHPTQDPIRNHEQIHKDYWLQDGIVSHEQSHKDHPIQDGTGSHEHIYKDLSQQDSIGSHEHIYKDHSTQDAIGNNEQSQNKHSIQDPIGSHENSNKDHSIQDSIRSHEQIDNDHPSKDAIRSHEQIHRDYLIPDAIESQEQSQHGHSTQDDIGSDEQSQNGHSLQDLIGSHEQSHKDHPKQDPIRSHEQIYKYYSIPHDIGSHEQIYKDHSLQDAIESNEQNQNGHSVQDAFGSHENSHKDNSIQDSSRSHEQIYKDHPLQDSIRNHEQIHKDYSLQDAIVSHEQSHKDHPITDGTESHEHIYKDLSQQDSIGNHEHIYKDHSIQDAIGSPGHIHKDLSIQNDKEVNELLNTLLQISEPANKNTGKHPNNEDNKDLNKQSFKLTNDVTDDLNDLLNHSSIGFEMFPLPQPPRRDDSEQGDTAKDVHDQNSQFGAGKIYNLSFHFTK